MTVWPSTVRHLSHRISPQCFPARMLCMYIVLYFNSWWHLLTFHLTIPVVTNWVTVVLPTTFSFPSHALEILLSFSWLFSKFLPPFCVQLYWEYYRSTSFGFPFCPWYSLCISHIAILEVLFWVFINVIKKSLMVCGRMPHLIGNRIQYSCVLNMLYSWLDLHLM